MMKNKIFFLFLFLSLLFFSSNTYAQTWTIQQNANQATVNQQVDAFSDLNKKDSWLTKILKPKFQFQLLDERNRVIRVRKDQPVQIWYLDSKRTRIWFCEISAQNWICELDLKNKSIEWTSWFFWIIIWWEFTWTLQPFDFELERNSQLEIWSSNVVHWFANIQIIMKQESNNSWYDIWSMKVIPVWWWNETTNSQIDTWEWEFNSDKIKWNISEWMWPWRIVIINSDWNEITEPFYINADENWNYNSAFELSLKRQNFEIWKNYSLVFYPTEKWVLRSWKTIRYASDYNEFKNKFDWTVLTYNKSFSTTVEPKFPIVNLAIIAIFCFSVVFLMDKYFIKWMNFLRWDKTQIWRISHKKPPFNF